MCNGSEGDRSIADGPAGLVFSQSDRLAYQSFADVDHVTVQLDLAVVADAPHFLIIAIFRLAQNATEAARGSLVAFGRRGVVERLVRTLFVVKALEAAQTLLLLTQALRRRIGNLLQQGQMHTLVATVFLRLAGGHAVRRHARLGQLHRQPRQSASAPRSKRQPVGGTKAFRQAKLAELALPHRAAIIAVVGAP